MTIINKYYPADSKLRDIFMKHSKAVTNLALEIANKKNLDIDNNKIITAGMLHDIGIFMTNAPGIECRGEYPYIMHGRIGADLLRKEGVTEEIAKICERHTGTGITNEEIDSQRLPLIKDRSYMPETILEKLICYADKFYSKSGEGEKKKYEEIRDGLARHSENAAQRFDEMHLLFGDE